MKNYMIAMYQPKGPIPPPEVLGPVMEELGKVRAELEASGSWVFGSGLHGPEAATVLRVRDGEMVVADGPYIEGKEYLGGFTIVRVPDLDAAMRIGRRQAEITGLPIEVWPFQGEAD
jgi:hypothetical protein